MPSNAKIAEVLYSDGEAVNFNDFNNEQRFVRSQIWDWVVGMLERSLDESEVGNSPTSNLYTVGNGGAPRPSGTNSKVDIFGGTIIQIGNGAPSFNGSEPRFVPYALAFDEISKTFTANSSGNDRWDIIQVKIDYLAGSPETRDFKDAATGIITSSSTNKKRLSQVTASVKEGVPAGSPVEQTPDTGFVKLCAVKIPNGHTTGTPIPAANIRDYRMPIGVSTQRVVAVNGGYNPAVWNRSGGASASLTRNGTAAVQDLALVPAGGAPMMSARLLRVRLASNVATGSNAVVTLVRIDNVHGVVTPLVTLTSDLISPGSGAWIDTAETALPFWMNGREAGTAHVNEKGQLALYFQTGSGASHTDQVHYAEFDVAGM